MAKRLLPRPCKNCKEAFIPRADSYKFCSQSCSSRHYQGPTPPLTEEGKETVLRFLGVGDAIAKWAALHYGEQWKDEARQMALEIICRQEARGSKFSIRGIRRAVAEEIIARKADTRIPLDGLIPLYEDPTVVLDDGELQILEICGSSPEQRRLIWSMGKQKFKNQIKPKGQAILEKIRAEM